MSSSPSGEKTEDPTPKRLRDARKKGQVAFSRDANGVVLYLLGIAVVIGMAPAIRRAFGKSFENALKGLASGTDGLLMPLTRDALQEMLLLTMPLIGALFCVGLIVGLMQTKLVLSFESLKPAISKINPFKKLKELFSIKSVFELLKTALKLFVAFVVGYVVVRKSIQDLLVLGFGDTLTLFHVVMGVALKFLIALGLVFAVIAAADAKFQRWQWWKGLKMTKDEVKREYKQQEGDPLIKGERRSLHQEMAMTEVDSAVRGADAVVVNPVHLAVVLEYKRGDMGAPKITLKGADQMARRIRKLAAKYDVPVVQDKRLARSLFRVPVTHYVPKDLYRAVAEVLSFAWRMRRDQERRERFSLL